MNVKVPITAKEKRRGMKLLGCEVYTSMDRTYSANIPKSKNCWKSVKVKEFKR